MYLRGRSSIAINSNYYILDSGRWQPTTVQACMHIGAAPVCV